MTMVATFCSHIILQKSATVSSFGPAKPDQGPDKNLRLLSFVRLSAVCHLVLL